MPRGRRALVEQLVLLYDGASVKGHLDRDLRAAASARQLAALLVDAALRG